MLAVDVDGTLITDHGAITDSVFSALEKAADAGWELVIASGRTFYAARRIAESLPYLRHAVLSNGACIMDIREQRVIHMETLAENAVRRSVDVMRGRGVVPTLYNTDQLNQRVYYDTVEGACEYFKWYVGNDPRCVMVDNVYDYTGDVLQIGSIAERDVIFSIRDELDGRDIHVVAMPFESPIFGGKNRDYWFVQIVSTGATKHNALGRLYDILNIPSGRLVAVGDNYNDADMIEHANFGVAMGNSPDEIKRLAKLVVGSNNHSGLSEVVGEVILSGKYFPDTDGQRGGGNGR